MLHSVTKRLKSEIAVISYFQSLYDLIWVNRVQRSNKTVTRDIKTSLLVPRVTQIAKLMLPILNTIRKRTDYPPKACFMIQIGLYLLRARICGHISLAVACGHTNDYFCQRVLKAVAY